MEQASLTLQEIAELTGATLVGNPGHVIFNVADLESATEQDASFLANTRYEQAMQKSKAGVVFIDLKSPLIEGRNFLQVKDPSLAFQKLVNHLFKEAELLSGFTGIHPSAVVHPTVKIGKEVSIGPLAVIDQGAEIGDRTQILAGCFVGPFTKIGADCILHANVTIRERCQIGNRVILQPGAVIGSCGFGYITDQAGSHIKLNQVGTVEIEDDVEIGSNTTIDRSRFKVTRIGKGSKIDNLVQIGHGVIIGEKNIIVAHSGIAGSTETGKWVVMGGQVGLAGHLKIGDGVILSARSGASKSIPKAGKYGGAPAMPLEEYNRNQVTLRSIDRYIAKIKKLEEQIEKLSKD